VRPLQESRSHLVATGSQAGMSLSGMPVPEMFLDRRTAASDGRAGKSQQADLQFFNSPFWFHPIISLALFFRYLSVTLAVKYFVPLRCFAYSFV